MTYTFQPRGVCSRAMSVEVDDQGVIRDLQVVGGCNGNLKAIGSLLEGADPKFAIERLSGICCGFKNTSCGDQLARAIRQAVGE